jgi:hypothetical protein
MRIVQLHHFVILLMAITLISCAKKEGREQPDEVINPDLGRGNGTVLRWVPNGPGPNSHGQVENITRGEVVGAINAVALHPTDENIVFVGAVNGGIWRTDNAMATNPTWNQQTDTAQSLSIGALEFDPTDASNQTLVAGIGRFSSFLRMGGARTGLLRTTDGSTWTAINGRGTLNGLNISGIAPRGNTLVISVNASNSSANRGIWRSTDTGVNWKQISGDANSGLPAGPAFDLASDPTNPEILYTNAGGNGIYRSKDTGATWNRVSNAAMNGLISTNRNAEIAVGSSNNVYVAIINTSGQISGVYRSGDGGNNWTAMDLPSTADGGLHPGGQGTIHLSIATDPDNANIVYIGGDRQARIGNSWPNTIGATDWTGNLFRGDASQPPGSQFTVLTHMGTASNSAPHADSRDMDVAANGMLIEGDDGGIYRRTMPLTNAGDWFSMNGDIQTAEFHDTAWDANSDIVISGAQDTGTPLQLAQGTVTWQSVSTADGGDVAVDDTSTPGISIRYSSNQFLYSFRRQVFDASNVFQNQVFLVLTVLNGGDAVNPQFYTPIELNNVDATRLIIGAGNSVYESLDQGDTLTEIGPGIIVNGLGSDPISYGATGNVDMLYVGSRNQVFIRTAAPPTALTASATYPGTGDIVDIAIDPGVPNTAFVADNANVFHTTDGGTTWDNVTGNLGTLNAGKVRSIVFRSAGGDAAVVGTDTGVFIAPAPNFNNWTRLGSGLPIIPVLDLDYDAGDRVFVAGTLGRGAWVLDENQ